MRLSEHGVRKRTVTSFAKRSTGAAAPNHGDLVRLGEDSGDHLIAVDDVFDIVWTHGPDGAPVTYRDVYHQNEVEQSTYNFEHADVAELFHRFDACEAEALKLVELGLPLPAYEQVMKASHSFNMLDARRAISVTERQRYILRVRRLAQGVAQAYFAQREKLGFPGLKQAVREAA